MPVSTAGPVVAGARRTFAPAATLFVLAPLIGEVLFGALPLSQLPFGLLGLIGLYGGGALLVRETARRRGLSAWWVVVLGMAYGIFEEGTVVQSLFDQHFRGLDFLGFYGHWAGVNWVWSLFIVPYHAVFSITIPIALAEALYPIRAPGIVARRRRPYRDRRDLRRKRRAAGGLPDAPVHAACARRLAGRQRRRARGDRRP